MLALYIPILPEHIWSKVDPEKLDYFKNMPMVCSGPFRVTEVKKSHWVTLEANPGYPQALGGPPHVQTVRFEIYQTPETMVADYKAGNLDSISSFTALDYKTLKAMPGTTVDAGPSIGFHQLSFNCWDSPKSKGNPLTRDVERPPGGRVGDRQGEDQHHLDGRARHDGRGDVRAGPALLAVDAAGRPGLPLRPREGQADPRGGRLRRPQR